MAKILAKLCRKRATFWARYSASNLNSQQDLQSLKYQQNQQQQSCPSSATSCISGQQTNANEQYPPPIMTPPQKYRPPNIVPYIKWNFHYKVGAVVHDEGSWFGCPRTRLQWYIRDLAGTPSICHYLSWSQAMHGVIL